jgi:hypothetical protein
MVEIALVLPPSSHTFDPVRMNDHQLMAGVHLQYFAPTTTYGLMKTPHIHVPQSDVDDLGRWFTEKNAIGEIAILRNDREALLSGLTPYQRIVLGRVNLMLMHVFRAVPLTVPAWQVGINQVSGHLTPRDPSR